jgi:hypothetical protein
MIHKLQLHTKLQLAQPAKKHELAGMSVCQQQVDNRTTCRKDAAAAAHRYTYILFVCRPVSPGKGSATSS